MTKETESELPQNCGTGYCSCIECLRDAIDDDEPTCPSCKGTGEMETGIGMMVCDTCHGGKDDEPSCARCGGPMYTQAHWHYMTVDAGKIRSQKNHDPSQTMRPMPTVPHDAGQQANHD